MKSVTRSLFALWVIFKHEFSLYFISPIVYFIGAAWLFFAGLFFSLSFTNFNTGLGEPSMISTLSPLAFLMIFIAPALTMRLLAEEIRTGTHELLFTAPVRDWEIVVGKWLGAWGVVTIFILLTLPYSFLLVWRGSPDQGMILTGYLGLWLLSGAVLGVGVFASSLTQYQLVAFMVSMAILIFLWVSDAVVSLINNPLVGDILRELTITSHYHQTMLTRGLIDPVDVAYFVALMAVSLFLATQTLGTRRWRA
ncbi:MAG TPA: hypothetical protein ENI95_12350 [Chloroflexi bacterium]|nr:hypothetical protein [Chloroflexota bacterium]